MWLIIGLMTLLGPVAILLLRGVIEGKKAAKVAAKSDLPSTPAAA